MRLEFVDMHELLPENWPDLAAEDDSSHFWQEKISTWVECFASLVSVLSASYPTYTTEFMAYLCFSTNHTVAQCPEAQVPFPSFQLPMQWYPPMPRPQHDHSATQYKQAGPTKQGKYVGSLIVRRAPMLAIKGVTVSMLMFA